LAILAVLLLPVACTAWIYAARDPAPHAAALDAVPLPPTWEVIRSDDTRRFIGPVRADRYYLVDADPVDAVLVLKEALRAAGYNIYYPYGAPRGCDPDAAALGQIRCGSNSITEDCLSNGPGGPITCVVEGYRRVDADPQHLEWLFASLAPRGSIVDHGPEASPRYVSDPNRALVTISASLTDPRQFWSSPTPNP
jgi:hypothetical protein